MTKPRRTLDALPGVAHQGGYVYVLLYSTEVVHVGRTTDARTELTARRMVARALGIDLADWWVSRAHAEWVNNEQWLREACSVDGQRTGPGCYSGIRFDLLTGKAHDLPFNETKAAGRRNRRPVAYENRDTRMAVAVRHATEDRSLRWIAERMSVSQTTIARDLARWERVRDSMPLDIIRLSRPPVTPSRNSGCEGAGSEPANATAVTAASDTTAPLIPFRRPA